MIAAGALGRIAGARPWPLAFQWLAGLAPFFFLSYGFANWVTGLRHGVPELAFAWERHIPFLPWTIVPYWSTDLFYGASLFLCRTRAELNTHGKRLLAVQLLCVCGFLLVPLRFGVERPLASGLFGQMFDALMSFDKPFNQAPSLHVAIITVLWPAFGWGFRGPVLWLIRGWFVLMALSTLTTYQHHFIDLPTGLWTGLFATALFPHPASPAALAPSRDSRRFVLGAIYLAGSAICGLAAWWIGGIAWVLLWPAASLAVVAGIYGTGRPERFGKSGGVLPTVVVGILGPYLAAARLSSWWFTRGQDPAQEIAGRVWLGRIPKRVELERSGVRSVVDLTAELPFSPEGVVYRGIPMLDLLAPDPGRLEAAVQTIAELETARPTLVFCALGYSRSAAAVAAWLVSSGRAVSIGQALEFIRARRPQIVVSSRSRALLENWAAARVRQ